ncbi:hypothetical protein IWZ03DRAFT_154172 [Phyllosticta citriasiana]|uniref:Uncharacterized protein n=1 Tax=Phyllosticta citriasiana TaxID=595635 RepID=A0ABR1KQK4_9PEZI
MVNTKPSKGFPCLYLLVLEMSGAGFGDDSTAPSVAVRRLRPETDNWVRPTCSVTPSDHLDQLQTLTRSFSFLLVNVCRTFSACSSADERQYLCGASATLDNLGCILEQCYMEKILQPGTESSSVGWHQAL